LLSVAAQALEGIVKILYVEDNDDNVYVVKNRFARVGFTVLVATDGEQGVAMAAAERPDLILMDLGLPGLDGWEATKRIKSQPETRHIPVIALSAHAMTATAGRRSPQAATTLTLSRWRCRGFCRKSGRCCRRKRRREPCPEP
jgi:CheY-like chemotaxis protein